MSLYFDGETLLTNLRHEHDIPVKSQRSKNRVLLLLMSKVPLSSLTLWWWHLPDGDVSFRLYVDERVKIIGQMPLKYR
jgi:hypothetical protein